MQSSFQEKELTSHLLTVYSQFKDKSSETENTGSNETHSKRRGSIKLTIYKIMPRHPCTRNKEEKIKQGANWKTNTNTSNVDSYYENHESDYRRA
jgi:hypothetical protein